MTTDLKYAKLFANVMDPTTWGFIRDQVVEWDWSPWKKGMWRTPNLVDWRSQDLSSIGQLTHMPKGGHCGGINDMHKLVYMVIHTPKV